MSLDLPPKDEDRPPTAEEIAAKDLQERKEQIMKDAFKAGGSKKKARYVSPYLTCTECNHIAFVDAFNLEKRLEAILRGGTSMVFSNIFDTSESGRILSNRTKQNPIPFRRSRYQSPQIQTS